MTNKEIIRKINEGFNSGNEEAILEHLADDIKWDMPDGFSLVGKEAFRKEASNAFVIDPPRIKVLTELEDGDYVAVEGTVEATKREGGIFSANFFDIYRIENGKVKEMRSYVIEKK